MTGLHKRLTIVFKEIFEHLHNNGLKTIYLHDVEAMNLAAFQQSPIPCHPQSENNLITNPFRHDIHL